MRQLRLTTSISVTELILFLFILLGYFALSAKINSLLPQSLKNAWLLTANSGIIGLQKQEK